MKRILKRILPFMVACAVVVFAACQETQAPTPTEPGVLEGRGGPTPQSQINQAINKIWRNPDRSFAHAIKSEMFDAGAGTPAAQAFAEELILLAESALPGADLQDVADLIHYASMFSGLSTNAQFVTKDDGGTVTTDPDLGDDEGFAGVNFEQDDLPVDVLVIVERQDPPCHPVDQVGQQGFGCFSFRTIPEVVEFDKEVIVGVCLDLALPPGLLARLRLFESEGPSGAAVKLLPEELTPDFLVTDCTGFLASTESSWLENFARAGWDKLGRPLASLLAPEPVYAATFLATSGSLGGRTKNFSNIGWAEVGLEYGTDGYRYLELDRAVGDTLPTGFETPGFDDSGWSIGEAPFWDNPGNANCAIINPDPGGTTWTAAADTVVTDPSTFTEILLRRSFFLPEDATNVAVRIAIDNDVQVFVNGVEVTDGIETHEGCATPDSNILSVDDGGLTAPGVNLLVVRAIDRGVMGYVDARVTFDTNGGDF